MRTGRLLILFMIAITCFIALLCLPALFIIPIKANVRLANKEQAAIYPEAILHLSSAIRIPTISDSNFYRQKSFISFHKFLNQAYPAVSAHLIKKTFGNSLLYEWKGSDPGSPAVILMSHYDVVPVEKIAWIKWQQAPFSGAIKDGYIWGRGAIDDKFNLIAMLEAVNYLLKIHYRPLSTIYFAFGADEETGGTSGNAMIANYLRNNKIKISFVLDEGLPITKGIINGIKTPIAAVGIAEKGYLSVRLLSEGESGHASMPAQNNAITRLSAVLTAMQQHPLSPHFSPVINTMFKSLLPVMPFSHQLIFTNLWLTQHFVMSMLSRNSSTYALIATTSSPTIIHGGIKDNVLPENAEAIINFRLAPGDTIESILSYLHAIADTEQVKILMYGKINRDPLPAADLNSEGFHILTKTIQAVFPDTIIAPSLMIAGTDSRYYLPLTRNIFRFYPWMATKQDIDGIHGCNERIAINSFLKSIDFYKELIRKT